MQVATYATTHVTCCVEGFIALQVHSIGEAYKEGAQVRWRDVKIMTANLASVRKKADPEVPIINTAK